jgi:hypothetical protein
MGNSLRTRYGVGAMPRLAAQKAVTVYLSVVTTQ